MNFFGIVVEKVIEFFKDTLWISIVSLVAFIVSVIAVFYQEYPISSYLQSICYSVIAAFIFYIIQIYVPEYKRKKLVAIRLKGFLTGRILDDLNRITNMLNTVERRINIEEANYIVEVGTEAYNNLFRCIDFYSNSMEIEILDTIIGLSENQFLYNLYYANQYMDMEEYINWIYSSFDDESGKDFLKLKEKLERLNSELPLYNGKRINN